MLGESSSLLTKQRILMKFFFDSMWHELRVVLHNRENALLTQAIQAFAGEEQSFAEGVASNWISLRDAVDSMPFE